MPPPGRKLAFAAAFLGLLLLVRLDRLTRQAPASNPMLELGTAAWAKNRSGWLLDVADRLECSRLIAGNATPVERAFARSWAYSDEFFFARFDPRTDLCTNLRRVFDFDLRAPTAEEAAFPLGFGMIVYKDLAQFYLALSAFYRPQNAHCIVVDSKSSEEFRRGVHATAACLPNVTVIEVGPIEWCTRSVLAAQFACFERLVHSAHPWRYYQYVTGFDVPLRTNEEAVWVLRELNDSVVFEHLGGQTIPLEGVWDAAVGLRVFSTSMASVVSRRAADDLLRPPAHSAVTHRLFRRLMNVTKRRPNVLYPKACVDELFFGTLFSNKNVFPVFGSFDGLALIRANIMSWTSARDPQVPADRPLRRPQLARFQVWEQAECKGTYRRYSCAYGLNDLPQIAAAHELFAHKFHADFDWAAAFCLQAELRRPDRSPRPPPPVRRLPHVRLHNGEGVEQIFAKRSE
ncbi:CBN-GLY-1 protein [Aphelenchoides fujianensis]|nr:CBN-GLY-1 protein [Aphelenchoides fujianensis]